MISAKSDKLVCHVLTENGVEADPHKVQAMIDMPLPTDKEVVRRMLGFVQ